MPPCFSRQICGYLLAGWMCAQFCALPGSVAAADITVFAAASLKNALDEIVTGFHRETGVTAAVSLAASSALAQQIRRGAPADIYFSANTGWMDRLEQEGLLQPGTRFDLLTNSIVLIEHGRTPSPLRIGPHMNLSARLGQDRLAMALVDAVPAGIYGKAALQTLGLWESVKARVAQTDNVVAALTLVATGAARLGIVYATDARASNRVTVLGTFPSYTHPPIRYPVAAVANRNGLAVQRFLLFLREPVARRAFERQGFTFISR